MAYISWQKETWMNSGGFWQQQSRTLGFSYYLDNVGISVTTDTLSVPQLLAAIRNSSFTKTSQVLKSSNANVRADKETLFTLYIHLNDFVQRATQVNMTMITCFVKIRYAGAHVHRWLRQMCRREWGLSCFDIFGCVTPRSPVVSYECF